MDAVSQMAGDTLTAQFRALFTVLPTVVARAPGRVNLLGEHTDYNDGLVLPVALRASTQVLLAPRRDRVVRVHSITLDRTASYALGEEQARGDWLDYVQGATHACAAHGHHLLGFDALVASEVPIGAGLSSSAALSVACLRALRRAFVLTLDDLTLTKLAHQGETWLGAPVGMLDPLACHLADPDHALFIDMRTLAHKRIALPPEMELLILHSGVEHSHAHGGYRERRSECEAAARLLGVHTLRDVDWNRLSAARLPAPLDRRVRHVLTENERVLQAVDALQREDLAALGRLFDASQTSMRDDFEISVPEVDRIVDATQTLDDVLGARMTGGGFGGAVICLVRRGTTARVADRLTVFGARTLVSNAVSA